MLFGNSCIKCIHYKQTTTPRHFYAERKRIINTENLRVMRAFARSRDRELGISSHSCTCMPDFEPWRSCRTERWRDSAGKVKCCGRAHHSVDCWVHDWTPLNTNMLKSCTTSLEPAELFFFFSICGAQKSYITRQRCRGFVKDIFLRPAAAAAILFYIHVKQCGDSC